MERYTDFKTIDEFILDDDFQDWVHSPDIKKDRFWKTYIEKHPEQAVIIQEARKFLQSIEFTADMEEVQKKSMWAAIEEHTYQGENQLSKREQSKVRYFGSWIRAAAALLLLAVSSVVIYNVFFNNKIVYRTDYGQINTIILPDQSTVVLNSNSELIIKKNFKGGKTRDLWLDGEAFFNVRHIPRGNKSQKFIVHTADLEVEVLGTEFNVKERSVGTEVVLQSGKVKLNLHSKTEDESLIMQPGDLVAYRQNATSYRKQKVESEEYLSWTDKKLFMNDIPMSEVIKILKENYGLDVLLADSTIWSERITGELPLTNKEVFLEAVSTTLRLTISEDLENNKLIIERK